MAPTLQDVTVLLDLPIVGAAASPSDAPVDWRNTLLGRFEGVLLAKAAAAYYILLA